MLCRSCHSRAVQVCLQKRASLDTALTSTTATHFVMSYVYRLPVQKDSNSCSSSNNPGQDKNVARCHLFNPLTASAMSISSHPEAKQQAVSDHTSRARAHTTVGFCGHPAAQKGEVRQPTGPTSRALLWTAAPRLS